MAMAASVALAEAADAAVQELPEAGMDMANVEVEPAPEAGDDTGFDAPALDIDVPPWQDLPEDEADEGPPAWDDDGSLPAALPPLASAELQAPAQVAPVPVAMPSSPLGDIWYAAVQQLIQAEAITALARELALQSELVAQSPQHWTIRVERSTLNQATARERLTAALAHAQLAPGLVVETGAVQDTPAKRNAAAAALRQQQAEALVHADPYVQQLMRMHGAKIVPGSIRPA